VTQELAVSILADEEVHRRLFEAYLREYEDGEPRRTGSRRSPARPKSREVELSVDRPVGEAPFTDLSSLTVFSPP
jgi:hypothetical protein